nr:hypothetical protein Iba_chr15aCG12670 [Ipomoea batatas]
MKVIKRFLNDLFLLRQVIALQVPKIDITIQYSLPSFFCPLNPLASIKVELCECQAVSNPSSSDGINHMKHLVLLINRTRPTVSLSPFNLNKQADNPSLLSIHYISGWFS